MSFEKLNSEQKKAVTYGDGPVLIVAGAGTGKTTVITERVAWLIEQKKAQADEILALTFTDKAANEMEERIDRLLPYGYVDLWVMTFHSFCERLLTNYGLEIGLPNDFKLLNQIEQWMLVKKNLDKFNLDYYQPLGNPTKFIHALLKHFSRCKDEAIWPADYLKYVESLRMDLDNMESTGGQLGSSKEKESEANGEQESVNKNLEIKRLTEVANAYHVYQQLLLDNEALDFGDLINYSLKLFRERPNILEFYRNKFKYILVDEFQDTNWAQYELIKFLAAPKNNLMVVGDDDQSIYKFRGASVANILQFKDDYPSSKEIYLIKNYRSKQNILNLAYNFIQLNNPERLEVKLQQKHIGHSVLNKQLLAQRKGKGQIEHLHSETENQEVKEVINKIIKLYNQGNKQNQISWNDFVILVRANKQAEAFLNALRRANIPFNFIASKGLYNKEIIQDILAYLRLLDNYHESLALWRILNLEQLKIKLEDLMELTRFANRKAYSLYEAIRQVDFLKNISQETKDKLNYIINKIKEHSSLAKDGVKQTVLSFLEAFKYNEYLIKQHNELAFVYLKQFFNKIDDFEKESVEKNVSSFMELINLEISGGEQGNLPKEIEEGPGAVKVMTVHAAKGLEFKYVFIVNLVDKRFPSIERREAIELPDALVKEKAPSGDIHLQEERRLFYVAMTRAKDGLWLTSADNYGGKTKKKLSRFLYEIGLEKNIKGEEVSVKKSNFNFSISKQNLKSEISKSKTKYQLPKSFSYSQLKAFETCPYQYYLAFILKVPVRGKGVFSYGKTMHNTLQKFMEILRQTNGLGQGDLFDLSAQQVKKSSAKILPSVNKLMELYQANWIDDWYESKRNKEKYYQLGKETLKGFYAKIKNNIPQVLELEKSFNFKLNNYTIKGKIDRVDKLTNGKVEIIDYKTGTPKTDKTLKDKDQLLIYQLAAQEVFGWQVEKLTYYYLNDNSQVSFLGSEKQLSKLKDKMLKLIEQIRQTNWQATPSQFNCQHCDFREICQYRQN